MYRVELLAEPQRDFTPSDQKVDRAVVVIVVMLTHALAQQVGERPRG